MSLSTWMTVLHFPPPLPPFPYNLIEVKPLLDREHFLGQTVFSSTGVPSIMTC